MSAGQRRAQRKDQLRAVTSLAGAFELAGERPQGAGKGPYGTRLSAALAVAVARALRPTFPGILPLEDGTGMESKARSAHGFKKLDVNYSTPELGLGLGVSIKTINYRDVATKRYTKNYSRNDNELRAEAMDYHHRQPHAVLVGLLFLPYDSCDDVSVDGVSPEESGISSFGAVMRYFRRRAGRMRPDDPPDLFERFFVCLHEGGRFDFMDVMERPPKARRPTAREVVSFAKVVEAIAATYDLRNDPPFSWAK